MYLKEPQSSKMIYMNNSSKNDLCRSGRDYDLHFSSSVAFRATINVDCNLKMATHRRQIEIHIYQQSMNEVVSKLITVFER